MSDELIIVKTGGSLPFRIVKVSPQWPYETMIRRFTTLKLAKAFLGALNGDAQDAKKWYREQGKRNLKQTGIYKTAEEAWRAVADDCNRMNWTPTFVGANPQTFEPEEEK